MGQAHSSNKRDVTEDSLRRSQRAIDKLFDTMRSSGLSAPRTYIALPPDVQQFFRDDYEALRETRETVSRIRRQPERLRGQVTHSMLESMDSALDSYERVFTQYMKTTTLALKVVPTLSASMDAYFKAVTKRIGVLETVSARFRKEMEQIASPVTANSADAGVNNLQTEYSDIMKTALKEDEIPVSSKRKELQKLHTTFQKNLKGWSESTA